MKKLLLFTLLSTTLWAAPQISVDQTVFDFGTVPSGNGTLSHTYKISNIGDEILKIQKVKPGCSCTVVEFPKEIKPGETADLTAGLKMAGRTGSQNKPITIISNSKDEPLKRLSLKAFIMGPLNLDRRYGIFQSTGSNSTIKDSLSIITHKEDLEVTEAYYVARGSENQEKRPVKTNLKKVDDKEGVITYKLHFQFKSDIESSEAGTIYFTSNHPEKKEFEFRCMIEQVQKK